VYWLAASQHLQKAVECICFGLLCNRRHEGTHAPVPGMKLTVDGDGIMGYSGVVVTWGDLGGGVLLVAHRSANMWWAVACVCEVSVYQSHAFPLIPSVSACWFQQLQFIQTGTGILMSVCVSPCVTQHATRETGSGVTCSMLVDRDPSPAIPLRCQLACGACV
jgi:hypothetical protein